ncbi:F0F1 ATP synthase subunit B [Actinomyces vulturis]|uniref:F0F1 ATP synthase subunit B n=1 Tax=Actinomyces vulturis TaxID=1857645 RepID=UPI0009F32441|nr:F0F1 ATP synthase subunit B [Actinomyces vulturis]
MNTLLFLAADSGATGEQLVKEEHSILLPETPDLVWGTVCFIIVAVVLMKYVLPKFTAILDERTRTIEEGLELTAKAKKEQANHEARLQREREEAQVEAAQIRDAARADAKAIIAKARDDASLEAGKAMDAAQRQLQADKQAAQISLRTDVGLLATELAGKIVGEQLSDPAVSERVIDRFLDALENDTNGKAASVAGAGAEGHVS